jgi:hypothetical protein
MRGRVKTRKHLRATKLAELRKPWCPRVMTHDSLRDPRQGALGTRAVALGVLFGGLLLLSSGDAAAADASRSVLLGEVSIADVRAHVDARDVREIAQSAIGRADWPSDLKRFSIVSVAVVSLERAQSDQGTSITCLVSATLRDRKTGNVYALVESRARKEQKTVTAADERAAVSVALENAISRLPSVVR